VSLYHYLKVVKYLVGDFDEQGKSDDDKQVVKDADRSHGDVDYFECEVTDAGEIQLQSSIFRRAGR